MEGHFCLKCPGLANDRGSPVVSISGCAWISKQVGKHIRGADGVPKTREGWRGESKSGRQPNPGLSPSAKQAVNSMIIFLLLMFDKTFGSDHKQFSNGAQSKVPMLLGGLSVSICFAAAVASLALAVLIVPRQVMPWTGLVLMYECTFTLFFLLFGCYLHLIYKWGKMKANQVGSISSRPGTFDYDSEKGHQRQVSCDVATCYYGLGMVFLAIAAPSLPCFFGITALFVRIGLMFLGGLVLASFMTYASEHLGFRFFLRGLEEKDIPRTRSMCFLC